MRSSMKPHLKQPIVKASVHIAHSKDFVAFHADLRARLQSGSHLTLYGPRGSGKSSLVAMLHEHYRSIGIPCGVASHISGLPDIVSALLQAYPDTDIEGLSKRAARFRLHAAADRVRGVLLLDHTTAMTTAMIGFLRRLRGGIAGALLVADVDSESERMRMRAWRSGALSVRMPLISYDQLHRHCLGICAQCGLPTIEQRTMRQIVRAARGRVGWISECMRRLQTPEYWSEGRLHAAILCTDTEIAVRESHRGPRLRPQNLRSRSKAVNP